MRFFLSELVKKVLVEEEDDDGRPEKLINRYVRLLTATANITSGLGTLALLWSTVVLLGGFVTLVRIKEFWFLTALSFLMAFRAVDIFDNECKRGIYMEEANIINLINRQKWMQASTAMCQRTMLGIMLLPKLILLIYLTLLSFNVIPYVSLGISIWRLVRQDYGDAGGDVANTAKMNAALDIFYALVMFQSLLVLYWVGLDVTLRSSVLEVALVTSKQCGHEKWSLKLVHMYSSETKRKFKKDGELPDRWSLITYGIELLQSASGDDDHRWGARVLDKLSDEDASSVRQELLSSRLSIQNLMGMIGPRATPENMEKRERAARIVAHLASELHITCFPGTLECICSLLESCRKQQVNSPWPNPDKQTLADKNYHMVAPITDQTTHEEQAVASSPSAGLANGQRTTYLQMVMKSLQRHWKFEQEVREYSEPKYRHLYKSMGAKELISQGLLILERLTQDAGNCTEISKDQRLLSMITAPLRSHDFLSKLRDKKMVQVLNKALTVLSRLLTGPGDGATRLRQELVSNTEAVSNLMGILETDSDREGAQELHEQGLDILAKLAFDDSFKERDFHKLFKALLCIFLEKDANNTTVQEPSNAIAQVEQADDTEKTTRLRERAAEALARLLPLGTARCTLSKQMAINLLTTVLNEISSSKMGTTADTSIGSNSRALEITNVESQPLEEADTGSVKGDQRIETARSTLSKQKEINVLTTALNEISSSKMGTTADTSIGPGGSNSRALEITIVESQPLEEADTDSVQPPAQENEKQSEERKFMSAMLSLAVVIYNENVISKEDFAYFATPEDDAALAKKLKEILEVNKDSTAECLRIVKLICQVVIAMIKVKPSCIQNFNGHNFKEALAEALETMSEVDDWMLFAGNDREVIKPARSLASLVKEAQELLKTATRTG